MTCLYTPHATVSLTVGSLLVGLALLAGCSVPTSRFFDVDSGTSTSPECWDPSDIIPELTCGAERPEMICPGSCAQTFDGVVGVGLASCRCVDSGSGFGGRWVCDTTACDGERDAGVSSDDGGMTTRDTGTASRDSGRPATDAGICEPLRFPVPETPGCNSTQYGEFRRVETQADYDAFVGDPRNSECAACLSQAALACGTARGCDGVAGEAFCCLDDACGDDEGCRNAAVNGACRSDVAALNGCVNGTGVCALNPAAPPAECFP